MGGTLEVDSTLGKGTCFTIRLPLSSLLVPSKTESSTDKLKVLSTVVKRGSEPVNLTPGEPQTSAAAPATMLKEIKIEIPAAKKVLIVEDEPLVLLAEQQMIRKMGCLVECAENGEVALKLVQAKNVKMETKYDLVLMDINMPVMNGYIASRKIKDAVQSGEIVDVPIVCLSAQESVEHKEKCEESGINERSNSPFFAYINP